ncbi:MAG TPA: XrtA-associated tyrosine autokinase, partial [Burkholderiaceae bacterium]|nr:XrtA-associated tyrosine autokinase [Burkholderiaceae bacterium]
ISIIEQAAKRLAELKRAGIDAPDADTATLARPLQDVPATPSLELAMNRFGFGEQSLFSGPMPGTGPVHAASQAAARPTVPPRAEIEPPRAPVSPIGRARSREVEIDLARLEAAGYVVAANSSSRIAEEFRIIKRPVVMNIQAAGKEMSRANMVMVTSSVPGEGKTFTAVNLALSIAMEMDKRVLLVDADVAQPSIPLRLGLSPGKGLLDLLSDPSVALADCLLRTNIEKFTILPAGTPHERSTELLASEAMSRLVAELTNRYPDRVVIFDTPPLLASSESRVLATYLGQVLFVVEADRTAQSKISEALSTIESCPVVMTVLNKARRTADAPYGYRH